MDKNRNLRNVSVIQDLHGNNIVIINDIIFKGRQAIEWDDVEKYLKNTLESFIQLLIAMSWYI